MECIKVKVKRVSERAMMPTRGSSCAAGYDLYACLPPEVGTNRHVVAEIADSQTATMVPTGWSFEIPEGYFGAIFARSGIAKDKGLRPANCVGVIDSDYRGEVKVALRNDTQTVQYINDGERIAQLVILPYLPVEFEEVEQLSETERGFGGFGSTGTN